MQPSVQEENSQQRGNQANMLKNPNTIECAKRDLTTKRNSGQQQAKKSTRIVCCSKLATKKWPQSQQVRLI